MNTLFAKPPTAGGGYTPFAAPSPNQTGVNRTLGNNGMMGSFDMNDILSFYKQKFPGAPQADIFSAANDAIRIAEEKRAKALNPTITSQPKGMF
jgi:hypothetical protein